MRNLKFVLWAVAFMIATACQDDEIPVKSTPEASTSDESNLTSSPAGKGKPGSSFPSYNTSPLPPDATGMTSNAVQLYAKLGMGINIGNTLEAIGGETAWGNPQITQSFVNALKQNGFNTVRLPCSWDQYSNQTTGAIQAAWLDRVKQVVQYCVNADMYVVLNIHWDGGWLDAHINSRDQAKVNAKQKAFWEQIATKMRDFDEHVMFAGTNEPPVEDAAQMAILLTYHQTFINAVRSTGGKNAYRVLVVQGPSTDIDRTYALFNTLPTDSTPNRMMVEVHSYTPYNFCLMSADESWGNMFYYWGQNNHSTIEPSRNATWGEEDFVTDSYFKMKTKFTNNGIPMILGEYGAYRRSAPLDMAKHHASVDHWATFTTTQAKANGVQPYWWDTGGMINRSTNAVQDQRTLDALKSGSGL